MGERGPGGVSLSRVVPVWKTPHGVPEGRWHPGEVGRHLIAVRSLQGDLRDSQRAARGARSLCEAPYLALLPVPMLNIKLFLCRSVRGSGSPRRDPPI